MNSQRMILIGTALTLLVVSCGPSQSRIEVVEEYLTRLNGHNPSAVLDLHTAQPEFAIPGQDVFRGREAMRALLQWDSVLGTRLDMSGFTERGDTVFIKEGSEQNRWFAGLGLARVEYRPGTMFVFDGHRIAGVYPTGFTERTTEEFMPLMQAFMAWASEHRSDDIEQVLPDGRFVYTPVAAHQWLDLLAAWASERPDSTQDRWDEAARWIRYRSPAEFPQAPSDVVRGLEDRACRLPQVWHDSLPHNLIRGEFTRPGQEDWAVLCSRAGVSQILVFWNGGAGGVDSLAEHEDKSFLQTAGPDRIGFSRRIGVVENRFISDPQIPRPDHQGIADAFVEKGASIYYYVRGRWVELAEVD